ncbi:MAG TPA: hypothetical protein VGA36_02535 [Nitriliruptorales bacterium]
MKTLFVALATLTLVLAAVPSVAADDPGPQCIIECDCPGGTLGCVVKRVVEDVIRDLKDQPCTCDPQPDPGP